MKTSTAGKILGALAFASMIGGLSMGQRSAKKGAQRGRDDGGWRDNRGWHAYQPVYVPPPVVYAPSPSPGISLFFPFFR
jgi:hypothetical protein